PDVTVDDVALGHEVGAPDRVQDLVAGHDAPTPAGEEVQKALFDAAQMDDRIARSNLAADDVDLHFAQPDGGHDRLISPESPERATDGSCENLLRREGHGQDVVDRQIERTELGLEVAPSGKPKSGD